MLFLFWLLIGENTNLREQMSLREQTDKEETFWLSPDLVKRPGTWTVCFTESSPEAANFRLPKQR